MKEKMENQKTKIKALEDQVQEVTLEMAQDVFHKARELKGQERLNYVNRFKKFGKIVGPEKYAKILQALMTNEVAIDELERMGRNEWFQEKKAKVKRWLS